MNTIVTSRDEILKTSRQLLQKEGWAAVNIRSVASACGVSVGSIYNYFGSKAELSGAVVESVWYEIFHLTDRQQAFSDTLSCVRWMFQRVETGCQRYPGFFSLHSLQFLQEEKRDGKQRMEKTWQHIREQLVLVLKQDPCIRENAFTPEFTPERFAGVLFSLLLSAMLRQDYDPSPVLEIVNRVLY